MNTISALSAKFAPAIAGAGGAGLLAITPGTIQDAGQLLITLSTIIIQLIALFKRKKSNNQ